MTNDEIEAAAGGLAATSERQKPDQCEAPTCSRGCPMTACDLPEGPDPKVAEAAEKTGEKRKAAADQAFAAKLAKRSPPNEVERAEIEKARKRTKARAPRIAMHIEDRETAARVSADCTAVQAVAAALPASGMASTVTASAPRPRLRSSGNSTHC
jgi:hypothetical protein